jgi:hypothetical protein
MRKIRTSCFEAALRAKPSPSACDCHQDVGIYRYQSCTNQSCCLVVAFLFACYSDNDLTQQLGDLSSGKLGFVDVLHVFNTVTDVLTFLVLEYDFLADALGR